MIVYLIGPSGVGKSSATRWLARVMPTLRVCDLDQSCEGRTGDWSAVSAVLRAAEQDAGMEHVVVDVGAGTQHDVPGALGDFLSESRGHVVLIWATAEEVFVRQPLGPDRPYRQFVEMEYEGRARLYAMADRTADVSGIIEAAAAAQMVGEMVLPLFECEVS